MTVFSKVFFSFIPASFGKCRYVYYGHHSEGNRFIRNNDLWFQPFTPLRNAPPNGILSSSAVQKWPACNWDLLIHSWTADLLHISPVYPSKLFINVYSCVPWWVVDLLATLASVLCYAIWVFLAAFAGALIVTKLFHHIYLEAFQKWGRWWRSYLLGEVSQFCELMKRTLIFCVIFLVSVFT